MITSAYNSDISIKDVDFVNEMIVVKLMDGRIISVPQIFYPRLDNARNEQRRNWVLSGGGYCIHWLDIDKNLSSEDLLNGLPAPIKELTFAQIHSE